MSTGQEAPKQDKQVINAENDTICPACHIGELAPHVPLISSKQKVDVSALTPVWICNKCGHRERAHGE